MSHVKVAVRSDAGATALVAGVIPPPSDAPAGAGPVSSNTTKVPAISANLPGDRHAALPTSYASC